MRQRAAKSFEKYEKQIRIEHSLCLREKFERCGEECSKESSISQIGCSRMSPVLTKNTPMGRKYSTQAAIGNARYGHHIDWRRLKRLLPN